MMYGWRCYMLVDPEDRQAFYIGITRQSWEKRLAAHGSDPASAVYNRLRAIRRRGFLNVA